MIHKGDYIDWNLANLNLEGHKKVYKPSMMPFIDKTTYKDYGSLKSYEVPKRQTMPKTL